MSSLEELNYKPCEKLDGKCVDAFVEPVYDPELYGGTVLGLSSTWGDKPIDLEPLVKAGETVTSLYLSPAQNPTALQYDAEGGSVDCIEGDALSRIISMRYLKDTEQKPLASGDIYMYDSNTSLFKIFNLGNYMTVVNTHLGNIDNSITNLENAVTSLRQSIAAINSILEDHQNQLNALDQRITDLNTQFNNYKTATNARLDAIEALLQRPAGIPTDTRIAWGNRNIYNDHTNTNKKLYGIFTHNTNMEMTDDTYYS